MNNPNIPDKEKLPQESGAQVSSSNHILPTDPRYEGVADGGSGKPPDGCSGGGCIALIVLGVVAMFLVLMGFGYAGCGF